MAGRLNVLPFLQRRVEAVAQPVTDQTDGESRHQNHDPRCDGNPPGGQEVAPAVAQELAKAGERRLNTEAEEAQRRFKEDCLRKVQRELDDQDARDVRQNVHGIEPEL